MRESGNPNQWDDSFPPRELVEQDIATSALHVCVDESSAILGCFVFLSRPELDYAHIYEGSWSNDELYDFVHRFAVLSQGQGKGIGGVMLDWAIEHGRSLRVDAHRDNVPMQGLLASRGFSYCGIIKRGAMVTSALPTPVCPAASSRLEATDSLAISMKLGLRLPSSPQARFTDSAREGNLGRTLPVALVVEQPQTREAHGHLVVVCHLDHVVVPDGAVGLRDVAHARAVRALDVVSKWEERVGAQGDARLLG